MNNLVPGNVASHGEHPWYTHILVNLPLLLGPLAPIWVITVLNWISETIHNEWRRKPDVRNVFSLILISSAIHVIGLCRQASGAKVPHPDPPLRHPNVLTQTQVDIKLLIISRVRCQEP